MDLTQVFTQLFTVNFLVFSLAVAGFTELSNRLITFFVLDNPKFKATRTSAFWNNVVMPSSSMIIAILIAIFSGDYAFPPETTIFNGRIMLAVVASLSSVFLLRLMKSLFNKAIKNNNSDKDS